MAILSRPSQWIGMAVALVAMVSSASSARANTADSPTIIPETQERLNYRYGDRALVNKILALDTDKAIEQYLVVLQHIEGKYVDAVKLERLLLRGAENLEQALYNPAFLETIVTPTKKLDPKRLANLREDLRRGWGDLDVATIERARDIVKNIADHVQTRLAVPLKHRNLVVLEFIFGACEALDPYSAYVSPDHYQLYLLLAKANIAGVGLDLVRTQAKQPLTVNYVLPNSTAFDAFIKPGDLILRIGEVPTTLLSPVEAQILLHGPDGSKVAMEIQSIADGTIRAIAVMRLNSDIPTIGDAYFIDAEAGIGYIQLQIFNPTAALDLEKAIADLRQQGRLNSLILDLRGNPGGSFAAAIAVADRFLPDGVIVATEGRAGRKTVHNASASGDVTTPLVVLVDGDTASAAEIVTGALKDHQRATIVGQKTYGKGTVQGLFELRALDSALRITTARYLTPLGTSLANTGISPDIVVDSGGGMLNTPREIQEAQNKAAIEQARQKSGMMPYQY